jgi:hypothetical protein
MALARFEPTIPAFKRAKTFHALDRAATETGEDYLLPAFNAEIKYSGALFSRPLYAFVMLFR